jgi:hypothetical protein
MHTIFTTKLRDHGITDQLEFTPEEFAPFQEQYDAILVQEELENQVTMPEPDPKNVLLDTYLADLATIDRSYLAALANDSDAEILSEIKAERAEITATYLAERSAL